MNNIKILCIGTSLSFIANVAWAQCVATQDCATLGYTETSCNGGKGVKCPFGNTWACLATEDSVCADNGFKYSCKGTGYVAGIGNTCGGKYVECSCASGYDWKNGACEPKPQMACVLGTLYYSDNTCSTSYDASKTLLGVVIYAKGDGTGYIMSVKPVQQAVPWDTEPYVRTNVMDKAIDASCSNTEAIRNLGSKFQAANAAYNYRPVGTPADKRWCLPAYDLLNYINNVSSLSAINRAIQTVPDGVKLGSVYNNAEYIWSSTEQTLYDAWLLSVSGDTLKGILFDGAGNKDYPKLYGGSYYTVRAVLPF